MKTILAAIALTAFAFPVFAADVGVSLSVGQPGVYGQIDIGNTPRPQLVYSRPVMMAPARLAVAPAPIYPHVPPGYAGHWRRPCREYNACGRPVYFVQDRWYNNVYVPRYNEPHREHRHRRHDRDGDHGRTDDRHWQWLTVKPTTQSTDTTKRPVPLPRIS